MYFRSLLLAGALALRANALLVLPEVEGDAALPHDEIMGMLPHSSSTPYNKEVDLPCAECPFRETGVDGEVSWTDGARTTLSLKFSVEDAFLLANGRQIFPPPPAPVTVVQQRVEDGAESEPIPVGYALEVMPLAASAEESGLELLSIRFTILDLDGQPVPLDTVAIGLIHDGKGNFYIAKADIEETAPKNTSWKQCRGKPNCLRKLLADRIRTLFASAKSRLLGMASRIPGAKGCHGRPGPVPRPGSGDSPFWAQEHPDPMHPGHGGPPHQHMHHMHHPGWERTASRIVRFILIPATLGVLAGLTASAVGMLVGQVIVSLWMRYRRSSSPQTYSHPEEGTESEKEGLMVVSAEDLPPAYTDDSSEESMSEKN